MDALLDKLGRGDRRSLARAMTIVDRPGLRSRQLADRLRAMTGDAVWWGFTGPPGVGKSTLIDALLGILRDQGRRIGVIAIDPTSPSSDGALLGDRVRMMRHAVDEDVFIRSLATHHREGGLSDAALHCARLLEQARFDPVLIETVGVGQNEVDIASIADVCVVLLGPGYGDHIQLIKAGLLEIADVVVVNKCDMPEAGRLLAEVREEIGHSPDGGGIETIGIEAKSGAGVAELVDKLMALDEAARDQERRRRSRRRRILSEVRRSAMLVFEESVQRRLSTPSTEELMAQLQAGECPLESVAAKLASEALHELEQRCSES